MTIESFDVEKAKQAKQAEQAEKAEEDPFVALAAQEEASERGRSDSGAENSSLEEGFSLNLTPRAVARLRALKEEEQDAQLTLRVRIYSGGCSGYRSDFSLDKSCGANDLEVCQDGVKVLIDKLSARTLGASELDFVNDIIGEGFTLRIAKAHNACGCGVSFGL